MVNFYSQQNKNNHDIEGGVAPSVLPAAKGKPKLERYIDPNDGLTPGDFKLAFWYVKNRVLLHRIEIVFLLVVCVATIGFSLWQLVNFAIFEIRDWPRMERELTASQDYSAAHANFSAQPLQALNAYLLPGGVRKNDAVAELTNPNERVIATFDYYFDFGGQRTPVQRDFLLPLETRPVAALGLDENNFSGSPTLVVENVAWQRVSSHRVIDPNAWQAERLNFAVSDFTFEFAGSFGARANAVKFSLTNGSPYGYKDPLFYVGLYQGGAMVGILKFNAGDFASLETKKIDLRSFANGLNVSEIKIFPAIDVYEPSVYLSP